MDSGRDGRESWDRQEFSGRCGKRKEERFDPKFGVDCEGIQGVAFAVVFETLAKEKHKNSVPLSEPRIQPLLMIASLTA